MKVGDLVYFSSQHLAFDYEQLRGQYGLLLEYVAIPAREGKTFKAWKTLWGEKRITVYEQDISLVEPRGI
jgi:hypothetical protein